MHNQLRSNREVQIPLDLTNTVYRFDFKETTTNVQTKGRSGDETHYVDWSSKHIGRLGQVTIGREILPTTPRWQSNLRGGFKFFFFLNKTRGWHYIRQDLVKSSNKS